MDDYCHACRRHLNGALACPGCGTPADALALRPGRSEPVASAGEPVPSEPYGDADGTPASPGRAELRRARGRGQGRPRADRRARRGTASEGRPGGTAVSRRDRKAAASHRRRRRRALLVGAGFVLAAGGLSLAELGADTPGLPSFTDPGPVTAEGTGDTTEAAPQASGTSETARAAGQTQEGIPTAPGATPSGSASASPGGGTPRPGQSGGDPSSPAAPAPSASASAPDAGAGADPGTGGTGTGDTGDDGTPVDSTPQAPEEPTGSPDSPEPEPSPTETCHRFLWWCT